MNLGELREKIKDLSDNTELYWIDGAGEKQPIFFCWTESVDGEKEINLSGN